MHRLARLWARAKGADRTTTRAAGSYPGDFTGTATIEYAPDPDGEEDHTRGKDRPALVVGRDGPWLLALMLTSRDHDRPGSTREGERWLDIGAGHWDREGRPSEVRVDRVLRLDPESVRREGATLEVDRFDEVAAALRHAHGWV
jgi:hypothetical protein